MSSGQFRAEVVRFEIIFRHFGQGFEQFGLALAVRF